MSIIQGVLKEERDRLRRLKGKYSEELKKLPHQTLSIKKRNDKEYVYLAERIGGCVKFSYVGPKKSELADSLLDQFKKKNEFKIKLKNICKDLKDIEKIVHD
jgi:hypothetical protein